MAMVDRVLALGEGRRVPHYCLAFPEPGSRGTVQCREYARLKALPLREWWDG